MVLPGFIATEGFPQAELTESAATRWTVSTPEKAAEAIVDAGLGGRPERYVPRPYWIFARAADRLPAPDPRGAQPRRREAARHAHRRRTRASRAQPETHQAPVELALA